MQLNKFIITEEFLDSMSEEEKIFAVQLGYFVNEMNMLYKCIRIPKPKAASYGQTPEEMAHHSFLLMFIRLLASKLYEAWKMVKTWEMSPKESKRMRKISSIKNCPNGLNKHFLLKQNAIWEKNRYIFSKITKKNLKAYSQPGGLSLR